MASRSVAENIGKARSFFLYGSIGAFQGDLNLLSNKSIINTCVMPVLLSGCENWVLSGDCLDLLESFIGEVAKRSLKWPKHFSNNAALVAMDLQSAKSHLLLRKLSFLRRQLVTDSMESRNVGVMALKSLIDDPESLCVVKECRDLEDHFGTKYTIQIVSDADSCSAKEIQKVVCNIDREKSFNRCVEKAPCIAEITSRGVA